MDRIEYVDYSMEHDETEDPTMGALYESIEARLWHAEGYLRRGEDELAAECLRTAWMTYLRFQDFLLVYAGDELRGRLVGMLAGPLGAKMATGPEWGAELGRVLAAGRAA